MGAPSSKVRPLKFLQEIDLEEKSCYTFRTQSAGRKVFAFITLYSQQKFRAISSGIIANLLYSKFLITFCLCVHANKIKLIINDIISKIDFRVRLQRNIFDNSKKLNLLTRISNDTGWE